MHHFCDLALAIDLRVPSNLLFGNISVPSHYFGDNTVVYSVNVNRKGCCERF